MKINKVWTPNGYQQGPVNSLVGKGESIIDYTNGTGTLVTKGKTGVDNQPSSVKMDDDNVIAGNDIDWSNGMKFSDQVAPLTARLQMYNNMEKKVNKKPNLSSLSKQTIQLQKSQIDRAKAPILNAMKKITDRQQAQHDVENNYRETPMYNEGKPASSGKKTGFFNKIWNSVGDYFSKNKTTGAGKVPQSWLVNGRLIPAIAEARMLQHWKNEQPKMPSIYAPNRYAAPALQALNKLSIDPYSQIQALNDKERQAYYSIQQNGGYTGGQRQAARVALALGNAKTAADILNNTQLQNNTYRQNWAEAALQEGSQDASRRQSAAQYAWEAYNRAHGAKTKGIETHLSNLGAMWQKYYADKIKNKQYEDILNIYQQDIDNKKEALKTIYGIGADDNKGTTSNTGSTNNSTGSGANNSYIRPTGQPYEMNMYQRSIQPYGDWQQKAISDIGNLPLPNLPYQHTNYLDTIDWDKYFEAQKKWNKIIKGNNGIPKSSQYTYYDKSTATQNNYLYNLIPQMIPTLPDSSKYMQTYQKYMGIPMDQLRKDYSKYLGGDLFAENSKEPLGFTRTSAPGNKKTISRYGFPINRDQMIRGLLLYNNNFKVPSIN